MKNKILIISYTFPPNPGIGGRRWAKFAKYFLRMGYDVKVITSTPLGNATSNWDKDTEQLYKENRVIYVDKTHPKVLSGKVLTSFLDKIKYRVLLSYIKLTTKGNYWDPSKKWVSKLIPEVEKQILEGYNNIIASGGPFAYLEQIVYLKDKYSNLNVSIDVRDPWTSNKTSFGYDILSKRRLIYEVNSESNVVVKADNIISVSEEMNTFFENYTNHKGKFFHIGNGFDIEDFDKGLNINDTGKINFVFAGTLYGKALHVFDEYIEALDMMKNHNFKLYKKLKIDFYGVLPANFNVLIKNHTEIINNLGFVSLEKANIAIASSTATLLFLTDDMTYSFSTKFYEYLAQKKPIFLFSKKGKAGNFLNDNELGFGIEYGRIYEQYLYAINQLRRGFVVNQNYEFSQHDVESLSKKHLSIIT